MNAREKFLIVILGAVIVLLGGFKLLIEPQMKLFATTNAEYIKAVSDKKQADQNVQAAASVNKENNELLKKIESASVTFFPELQNDKIQIFFQGLADKVGVTFDSFIMTNKTITQITSDKNTSSDLAYPAKDAAQGIEHIEKKESTTSSTSNAQSSTSAKDAKDLLEMIVVSLQFKGSYEQGVALLDQIKNSGRTLRISSVNMATGENGQLTVSISAECFGIVKFTGEDDLSKDTLPAPAGKANPFQ